MSNLLTIKRTGSGDDVGLELILSSRNLCFSTAIFVNEASLLLQAKELDVFLAPDICQMVGAVARIELGLYNVELTSATHLTFTVLPNGIVIVTIRVKSLSGRFMLEKRLIDSCQGNFCTDIASLDDFSTDFTKLAHNATSTASLSLGDLSDLD